MGTSDRSGCMQHGYRSLLAVKFRSMRFIFEVPAYNELDHHTPVAEALLKNGHTVCFIFGDDPRLPNDPRTTHLSRWTNFKFLYLSELASPFKFKIFRLLSRIFFGRPLRFTKSSSLKLGALVLTSKMLHVVDSPELELDCAISGWGDPSSFLMISALAQSAPIVALPHGYPCQKNYDFNPHVKKLRREKNGVDFSLRNQFNAYVVATERNCQLLQSWKMSSSVLHVWGNARFSPEWTSTLRFILPNVAGTQSLRRQRVLVLLPASTSGFKTDELVALLERLSMQDIELLLKPHTREFMASFIPGELVDYPNVTISTDDHTTKLIEYADTVLNFATGAAIEALFMQKRFIFLKYLTENRLSWEDCAGIKVARCENDVIEMVNDTLWTTDIEKAEPYIQDEVFAGGTVEFPAQYYAQQLVSIAASGSERSGSVMSRARVAQW